MGKLVIISHEFSPFRGGAATYAAESAAAAHRIGHEVEIWAPDYGETGRRDQFPFRVRRLRSGGSLHALDVLRFAQGICRHRDELKTATVVLASVGAHMAFMLRGGLRAEPPRIITLFHGSEALRFGRNPFWRFLGKRLYHDASQVATVSYFSEGLIRESNLISPRRQISIAPPAGSSAAARPVERELARDHRIRILTLARIDPRKGQLEIARALAQLPSELRERVHYSIAGVGDTGYLESVLRVLRDANLSFDYLGDVPAENIAALYQQCDIYAMTSRTLVRSVEGFGITYLEAGYHGKPVVAYDSGGTSEAVIDNETGLLVKEGDLAGLTEALARLIQDSDLRKRMGERGREHARQFSWETTVQRLLG